MTRLRPVRRAAPAEPAACSAREENVPGPALASVPKTQPGQAGLQNPYGRYYGAPRSLEQLVQAWREAADDGTKASR